MFRATLRTRTPEGALATVIVTRQGLGRAGRIWLTFDGAIKTTAVMDDPEARHLADLLGRAGSAG
jgi:hypothetical protein